MSEKEKIKQTLFQAIDNHIQETVNKAPFDKTVTNAKVTEIVDGVSIKVEFYGLSHTITVDSSSTYNVNDIVEVRIPQNNYDKIEIINQYTSAFQGTFTNSDLVDGILTITHDFGDIIFVYVIVDNNKKGVVPDDITFAENLIAIDLTSQSPITGTWQWKFGMKGGIGATGFGVPSGGTTGQTLKKASDTDYDFIWSSAGSGDVTGAASSTDNAIARFDSTSGKIIQNSLMSVDDNGSPNIPSDQTYKVGGTSLNKSHIGVPNIDNTSDQDKPISTATQTALNAKLDKNTIITGATKTKITYDVYGLVTAGRDATTADIADSTDKRYVTETQKTILSNTSGSNSGDETTSTIKTKLGTSSVSTDGYLTSTDWNTFNNKQDTLQADTDYLTPDTASSTYEPLKGADDNYVTDAQLIIIGNTSGTNSGDETVTTIKNKLSITTLSGSNTGDEDSTSIKTKLGITTLSGSNTGDQTLAGLGGVAANASITGATKTKITYDAKGLVTSGADATTADISDGTDKRYCTDTEKTAIGTIGNKANDNAVVHNSGDETVAGVKTFSSFSITPSSAPTTDYQVTNKKYVDDSIVSAGGYTDEKAQDAVGGILTDTNSIDFTYNDAGNQITADVKKQNSTSINLSIDASGLKADANFGTTSGTVSQGNHTHAESSLSFTDITTNDASTTAHGFTPKAVAPAANALNVVGITHGETGFTDKTILDGTTPSTQAFGDSASAGTSLVAAHVDHKHAMMAAPTLSGLGGVATTRKINGKDLSGDITLGLASADFVNQGTTTTVLHGNASGNPVFGAIVEADITLADNTTNDSSTTKHGFVPKATAPASGLYNYIGITNGETVYSNKALFDATNPSTQAFGDSAAVGSATVAARRDHKHAMMSAPTSVSGNAGTVTGATFTKNLTVDTGNIVLHGNADNTSALTIGSGAVSVSGSNTGDQTLAGLGGVPTSTTVNGHALSGNISVTTTDLSLNNVTNNAQVKKISSSTDNAITRWDGTSGDTPQDSLATIDDSGSVNIPTGQAYKVNNVSIAPKYKVVVIPAATLGSTGDKHITGVGFTPKYVQFFGEITSTSYFYMAHGGMDGTTQWTVYAIAGKCFKSSSYCLAATGSTGTLNFYMSYVSFDADGFTVNVGDAGDFDVVAVCYG